MITINFIFEVKLVKGKLNHWVFYKLFMGKNKKIEQKVNSAFHKLENPTRFEGTSLFDKRVMAALR